MNFFTAGFFTRYNIDATSKANAKNTVAALEFFEQIVDERLESKESRENKRKDLLDFYLPLI